MGHGPSDRSRPPYVGALHAPARQGVDPNLPRQAGNQRAAETRMGKGKGAVDHWVAVVKPGRMLFELSGLSEEGAKQALRLAAHKLAIKTKFTERVDILAGE